MTSFLVLKSAVIFYRTFEIIKEYSSHHEKDLLTLNEQFQVMYFLLSQPQQKHLICLLYPLTEWYKILLSHPQSDHGRCRINVLTHHVINSLHVLSLTILHAQHAHVHSS